MDFRNAFNSIRRDKVLEAVQDLCQDIYPLVHSSYSAPSSLLGGESVISSQEGVQQGDPLGPLLFCLALHRHCMQMCSFLSVMYMDDVSIGGTLEDVQNDLQVIKDAEILGLSLNPKKCELVCVDHTVRGHLVVALPGVEIVVSLLGSPLGDIVSIDRAVKEKLEALKVMGSRFQHISAHDALTLLRHSFSIPKLRYLLRTAPCFLSSLLEEYDHTLRTILSSVINTPLLHNDRAWLQAVLPVKSGGLGVRRAADLAPAAYLVSTYSTDNLVSAILGQHSSSQSLPPAPFCSREMVTWSRHCSTCEPWCAGGEELGHTVNFQYGRVSIR